MRLVVDAAAWRDLDDIGSWIAKDRPAAARAVLLNILRTIEQLQHFPRMARPGRAKGTYERVVSSTPYIVVFQLWQNPPVLVVVAVVHGARKR